MNGEKLMKIIGETNDDYIQSAMETRGRSKKRHRGLVFVSKVAIVAAVILSMAVTVYATDGEMIKTLMGRSGRRYSSFAQIDKAMEQAKVQFEAKESFSNGYTFKDMSVDTTRGLDEDGNELLRYQDLNITYTNPEGHRVSLSVHPDMESLSNGDCPVKESRLIGDITVEYKESTYRLLPANREGKLTEEEISWRELPGNYISFSSDVHTPYESKVTQMFWVKDGLYFLFTDLEGNATADVLFSMAAELIGG